MTGCLCLLGAIIVSCTLTLKTKEVVSSTTSFVLGGIRVGVRVTTMIITHSPDVPPRPIETKELVLPSDPIRSSDAPRTPKTCAAGEGPPRPRHCGGRPGFGSHSGFGSRGFGRVGPEPWTPFCGVGSLGCRLVSDFLEGCPQFLTRPQLVCKACGHGFFCNFFLLNLHTILLAVLANQCFPPWPAVRICVHLHFLDRCL